jgi:hypothetical protein
MAGGGVRDGVTTEVIAIALGAEGVTHVHVVQESWVHLHAVMMLSSGVAPAAEVVLSSVHVVLECWV